MEKSSIKRRSPPEELGVAGFFGSFNLMDIAEKARGISEDNIFPEINKNGSDDVPHNTSLRQIVTASNSMPQDEPDRQTDIKPDRQTEVKPDRQYVTTSDDMTYDTSLRQKDTTSDRHSNFKISQGVTQGQKPVLKWLINMCGEEIKIVTYKMIHESLLITERAARTHIEALHKKGYIFAKMATRPNSLQPIGKAVSIKPAAHLAMALSNSAQDSNILTHAESYGHNVTTSDRLSHGASLGQTNTTSDRHTYCSSSYNTTTEEEISNPSEKQNFERLILDDWEQWGLRPKSILEHLDKDISILQNLLDKTAYVIRQKEGKEFAIQSKIGFLKKCLENEFCEVDNNFISRKEKVIRLRTEQMKREVEKLRAAKEEEREIAIELLRIQLSEDELKKIRDQTIEKIRQEMKQPRMMPSEAVIDSYEKNILTSMAAERGLFLKEKNL